MASGEAVDPIKIDRTYRDGERRHVYVWGIMFDGNVPGPVKIGHAANPKIRVAAIEGSIPFRCHMHFHMECPPGASVTVEARAHEYLRDFAIRNEWFAVHPSQAIDAVRRAHADVMRDARGDIVLRRSHCRAVQSILGLCNSHCAERYGVALREWTACTAHAQIDPMIKPPERAERIQRRMLSEGFQINRDAVVPPAGHRRPHWTEVECLHCFKFGRPHPRALRRFFDDMGWTADDLARRADIPARVAQKLLAGSPGSQASFVKVRRALLDAGSDLPSDFGNMKHIPSDRETAA